MSGLVVVGFRGGSASTSLLSFWFVISFTLCWSSMAQGFNAGHVPDGSFRGVGSLWRLFDVRLRPSSCGPEC